MVVDGGRGGRGVIVCGVEDSVRVFVYFAAVVVSDVGAAVADAVAVAVAVAVDVAVDVAAADAVAFSVALAYAASVLYNATNHAATTYRLPKSA